MRVLVTGAGGNLGRAVVPALVDAGHEPVLLDFRPLSTEHDAVEGDVRDRAAVERAMHGVDAVVHAAARHGIHLQDWSAEDFWSSNVTGTFLVYEAARAAGVRKVVLGSSMVVYGDLGDGADPWEAVTEQSPLRPSNLYGLTKVLCEDIASYHGRAGAISTVALRLGMFVPETFLRYGFRLLFGGVDDRDVAHSVLRALAHDPEDGFAAFNIMADSGLSLDDLPRLSADALGVLDERYPGTTDWCGVGRSTSTAWCGDGGSTPSTARGRCWATPRSTTSRRSSSRSSGATRTTTRTPTSRGGASTDPSGGDENRTAGHRAPPRQGHPPSSSGVTVTSLRTRPGRAAAIQVNNRATCSGGSASPGAAPRAGAVLSAGDHAPQLVSIAPG